MSGDLLQTFQDTYTYINNVTQGNNYQNLVLLLHDYVVMKKVDDMQAAVLGKQNVSNYFNDVINLKNDNAQFTPVETYSAIFGSVGLVWGSGNYLDKRTDPVPSSPNLAYSFVFRNVGGNWLALLLAGALI